MFHSIFNYKAVSNICVCVLCCVSGHIAYIAFGTTDPPLMSMFHVFVSAH